MLFYSLILCLKTFLCGLFSRIIFAKDAEIIFLVELQIFLPHKRGKRDGTEGVWDACVLM